MTIPKRILLHVAIGAGAVIAVATAATYWIVYNASKQRDLRHLATYVEERAHREEINFRQIEANLTLVRGQFLKRMEAPVPGDFQQKWNERFRLYPDGAWRSREEFADGRKWSTLWAHKNCQLTPEWQAELSFGGIDSLVVNAGGPPPGRFADLDDAKWQAAVELTLM